MGIAINTAHAGFYVVEFWGEASPPDQGDVWDYDGVQFGDNPEAHGRILYDTDSNEVTSFWIDMPTLSGSNYRFEDPTGYPGAYNPSTNPGGPINGDGDYFSVSGSNLFIEFELYEENNDWWGNYQIQDQNVQFSIGGEVARAVEPEMVPIPGAVWLLSSVLVGILGFRKKFRR
jgi:hypothetical protein